MTLSLPYYYIDKSSSYAERVGFAFVFPTGSLLSTFAYGRGYIKSLEIDEKWKNSDAMSRYYDALQVYDYEDNIDAVITSAGTQAFLLGMGLLLMYLGEENSSDWRLQNTYAIGMGLTVHSSWMLTVDLTELIVRMARRHNSEVERVKLRI